MFINRAQNPCPKLNCPFCGRRIHTRSLIVTLAGTEFVPVAYLPLERVENFLPYLFFFQEVSTRPRPPPISFYSNSLIIYFNIGQTVSKRERKCGIHIVERPLLCSGTRIEQPIVKRLLNLKNLRVFNPSYF